MGNGNINQNKDLEQKIDLVIKQNEKILEKLKEIEKALPMQNNCIKLSKAVEEFLEDFINNYP